MFRNRLILAAIFTSIALVMAMIIPVFIVKLLSSVYLFKILALIWAICILNIGIDFLYKPSLQSGKLRLVKYAVCQAICFSIIALFNALHVSITLIPDHQPGESYSDFFASIVVTFIICSTVQLFEELIMLKEKQVSIQLENAELRTMNVEVLNQQLKQQIHPHFLFNSLNTLKTLIKRKPEVAETYLIKLSDFLRASLSASQLDTVRLSDELKLCLDYLDMQKIRFGDAFQFSVNIPIDIQATGYVPVFAIQFLLENAIKHNAFTSERPLTLNVKYAGSRIIVTNNVQPKSIPEPSTNLGLNNLKERYRLLCGEEVGINKLTKGFFSVDIKVLSK